MKKRITSFIVVFALLLCIFAVPVSANAPADWENEGTPDNSPIALVLFGLITLGGIVGTCFLEWLVATFFGLDRKYGRLIVLTNLVSQILMRLICLVLAYQAVYDSVYAMIAMEIPVYVLEYLFYRWKMREVSTVRCLLYTLTANTASLLFGLLLNGIL